MKKLFLFNLLLLLSNAKGFSQGENNHWYFGGAAGVQFANGAATITPTVLTNANSFFRTAYGYQTISGGCASVSKSDGSLLFYTDGRRVYNKNHQIMAGTPIGPGPCNPDLLYTYDFENTRQAAIIFPNPGNVNQYYVLSAAAPIIVQNQCGDEYGYYYTLVDFTSNPNGQIITFRQPFPPPSMGFLESSQAMTVTINQNGDGFWVMIPVGKTLGRTVNELRAYKVDNTGLSLTPTVVNPINYDFIFNCEIKVSLDIPIDKLVIASGENSLTAPKTRVYGFDRQTGMISGSPVLSIDNMVVNSTEFSSDGNLLYAMIQNPNGYYKLVVYDLNNPSAPYRELSSPIEVKGSLQRAIDGNIYFTNLKNNKFLFKIDNQNSFLGSSISSGTINLGSREALFGLPQLVPVLGTTNDCLSVPTLTLSSPGSDMSNNTVPVAQTLREKHDWIKASNVINVGNTTVGVGVVYHAGNFVELNSGFEAVSGSQFTAYIEDCSGDFVYKQATNAFDVEHDLKKIAEKIKLYPNPSNSFVIVDYNVGFNQVTINSIDGKIIYNQKNDVSNSKQIDISNFKNGIYTLSIVTADGDVQTVKLIKN